MAGIDEAAGVLQHIGQRCEKGTKEGHDVASRWIET
jgi:hypothetical protein